MINSVSSIYDSFSDKANGRSLLALLLWGTLPWQPEQLMEVKPDFIKDISSAKMYLYIYIYIHIHIYIYI